MCVTNIYCKPKQDAGANKEEHPIHLLNLIPSQASINNITLCPCAKCLHKI